MPSWKFLRLYGAVECNPGDFNGDGQVDLAFGQQAVLSLCRIGMQWLGEKSTIGQEIVTEQLLTEAAWQLYGRRPTIDGNK
jgi:hypothetical protein